MTRSHAPGLDRRALAPSGRRNIVAFSGGPDSVCLLHLLVTVVPPGAVLAIHVDHGLDPGSAERARRAQATAERLGADCRIEPVAPEELQQPGGREAAARRARYARLQAAMRPGDHVLTAHHADDQAETVLLRLLRGAGPRGLAGMRPVRPLEPGQLGRPLLDWTRDRIRQYLERHGLAFIEDPTNRDLSLDRNFLRHGVLPVIAQRWPGYRSSLVRVARWQHSAAGAVEARAAADREALAGPGAGAGETTLALDRWLGLDAPRAFSVIRDWCECGGIEPPAVTPLESFREQCRVHGTDRQPELDWSRGRLHAWRGRLWLDAGPRCPDGWNIDWTVDGAGPDTLGLAPGDDDDRLEWQGAPRREFGTEWQVGAPRPGDRIRPGPGRPHRRVPELLREADVPPWRRARVPCIRVDGTLRAVGTGWVDPELAGWMHSRDCRLAWHRDAPALLPFPKSFPE